MTFDFAPPLAIASTMVGFHRPWCIAGGWALDLWLGQVTRNHQDVEIALLRDHQIELREYLEGWKFKIAAMDKRLIPWKDGRQMLMLPVHELHGTSAVGQSCEFLLNESDGIDWMYRRDFNIRMNLSQWILHAAQNVPILNPLIVLLYKSKARQDKDELDFRVVLERLDDDQKMWLRVALLRSSADHPWINQLA